MIRGIHRIPDFVTEEDYIAHVLIYLEHAYPDDKPLWMKLGKDWAPIELSCQSTRESKMYQFMIKEHREHFFKDGIPEAIGFGSWIQPHMKLRINKDGEFWVESNERSDDGKLRCELSRETKRIIENHWKAFLTEYYDKLERYSNE